MAARRRRRRAARVRARRRGRATTTAVEADLSIVDGPLSIFDAVERALGSVTALVLSHAEGVDSDILDTTIESFDLWDCAELVRYLCSAAGGWINGQVLRSDGGFTIAW